MTPQFSYHHYTIYDFEAAQLNEVFVEVHSLETLELRTDRWPELQVRHAETGFAHFGYSQEQLSDIQVRIVLRDTRLSFSCTCGQQEDKLCRHQSSALYEICCNENLRIFFDEQLRTAKLREFAKPYGLHHEPEPEKYFCIEYINNKAKISASSPALLPVGTDSLQRFAHAYQAAARPNTPTEHSQYNPLIVFRQHRYYKHLHIELYEASFTQSGKPKNPLTARHAIERVWKAASPSESKFFTAIDRFQSGTLAESSYHTLQALKAVLANPLGIPFYRHDAGVSVNVTAASLSQLKTGRPLKELKLYVEYRAGFYEVQAEALIGDDLYPVNHLALVYGHFLQSGDSLHLIPDMKLIQVIAFLKEHSDKLLIHESRFDQFRESVLQKLEQDIEVHYSYLPPAEKQQLSENGMDKPAEKLLYLTDSDPFIELNPVMKYGQVEIPVLSKKPLILPGFKTGFLASRDEQAEIDFVSLLTKLHSHFEEQLEEPNSVFYLHKKQFLDETWFLKAFAEWQEHGITILGFNKLSKSKLNLNPAKVNIKVLSGIDWFNAEIDLRYGDKRAAAGQIRRSLRNKSRYVRLDDGTQGILPQKWIEKFTSYFEAGEVMEDTLKIPRTNFQMIGNLFEEEQIDPGLRAELEVLNKKADRFLSIEEVDVPEGLLAHLRSYQRQGLNWLNFLDEFNFGGCLADDMGLGKSVQILAFVLLQRKKRPDNTNLLVVPASLIFNWQQEIQKFAPSLSVLILYGNKRNLNREALVKYELIITTYGTLLADIRHLKSFSFNYVFLDESQNIKNPDSERYKAACLLKSRARIAITGTPVENNTFDLYGQLSFTCPGLLGNRQFFKELYAVPIDQFDDRKRAAELQQKVRPFILRRTKEEVAPELPEKTEMLLFCDMGAEQRNIYNAVEREFRDFICSKTNEELPASSVHVLSGLTRLRQICNSPLLLNDEEINVKESGKIDLLLEQITEKSPKHKILVFSQFVSMLQLIEKELLDRQIGYSFLSGSTRNRDRVVGDFQTDETRRIFLISLKAGGTGLNLTQADYVYLVDPWWNPAVENQAIDRIYRIGQKKNVVAVRLITKGTIEEKISDLQQTKKDLFDELVNSHSGRLKALDKEGLLKLLN